MNIIAFAIKLSKVIIDRSIIRGPIFVTLAHAQFYCLSFIISRNILFIHWHGNSLVKCFVLCFLFDDYFASQLII